MKIFLFPHSFRPIGWILFVPSLIIFALYYISVLCSFSPLVSLFDSISLSGIAETAINDLIIICIALGALFIVCSKERIEDEMTRAIRLSSFLTSIYVYVILLVICTVFINGIDFIMFSVLNLVLFPIIFVCNFRLELHKCRKICKDEEQD